MLTFRTIDLDVARQRSIALANYRDTHRASYGPAANCRADRYIPWLRSRLDEFPDGHVLAYLGKRCVGQLELQVPYGLGTGYVNLYCVTSEFRGQGFGRLLHEYAEKYFRSWDADRVELHVAASNTRAVGFYRHMGYKLSRVENQLWLMSRSLDQSAARDDKRGSSR